MKHLHFHLRPVQGFFAEARRTRDIWAGSFLLSRLVGEAAAWVRAVDGLGSALMINGLVNALLLQRAAADMALTADRAAPT